MQKFVLRYAGPGSTPSGDIDLVRKRVSKVLAESGRMLLVESDSDGIRYLEKELPQWRFSSEVSYSIPNPQYKIERPID